MVEVYRGTLNEVVIIQNLLENNGIEVFVLNEIMANVEPWVVSPGGFKPVALTVNDENLDAATKIIEDFNSGSLSLNDE